MSKPSKQFNKNGKRLFGYALDGFYYFEDDQIEELLDKALLKFQGKEGWRKKVRAFVWSFADVRQNICKTAQKMFNEKEI